MKNEKKPLLKTIEGKSIKYRNHKVEIVGTEYNEKLERLEVWLACQEPMTIKGNEYEVGDKFVISHKSLRRLIATQKEKSISVYHTAPEVYTVEVEVEAPAKTKSA